MRKIILIGDIVDKGPKLKETVEFVHKNWKAGIMTMLLGNHENYVYKALKGKLERDTTLNDIQKDMLEKVAENPLFRALFHVYEDMEKDVKFLALCDIYEQLRNHEPVLASGNSVVIKVGAKTDNLVNHTVIVTNLASLIVKQRIVELEATYFNSIFEFEKDEELKEKFFELVEASKEFYSHKDFILTHSPCKNVVLGKVSNYALKAQRNLIYPKKRDYATPEDYIVGLETYFSYLKEEARFNHPKHIMGHVSIKNVVNFYNKYMIDTGCVSGGKMTSIEMNGNGKPFIQSVNSLTPSEDDDIISIFERREQDFNLEDLAPEYKSRIKYLVKDKINFISGTMAPAEKDETINDIESLNKAIKYYEALGVEKLILQPKYMGSRGNVYLFKNIEDSYLVSRNGFKVKNNYVPTEDLMEMLKPIHDKIFRQKGGYYDGKQFKMILLDCEVLPWRLMGKGLIDNQFTAVGIGITTELEALKEYGFEERLEQVMNHPSYVEYLQDTALSKDELTAKYGNAKERTLRNTKSYVHVPFSEEEKFAKNFKEQVKIYGDADIKKEIKPFSILKVVFEDDTEMTFENESNIEMFKSISDSPYAILEFKKHEADNLKMNDYMITAVNERGEIGYNTAKGFYHYVTSSMRMEGIVIKPEKVFTKGIAPYLKVRNKNYLTIVYGHNYTFDKKFEKLIRKKGTKRKMQTSINEFELGIKMLKTPYNSINDENLDFKKLLARMIVEIESEKTLDPRL